jgi:Fe-S-cluster containining protein
MPEDLSDCDFDNTAFLATSQLLGGFNVFADGDADIVERFLLGDSLRPTSRQPGTRNAEALVGLPKNHTIGRHEKDDTPLFRKGSAEAGWPVPPRGGPFAMLAHMLLPARDAELVQIVDASLADAARRAGQFLACRIGCTQCCHGSFAINALDVARLQAGMIELHAADASLAKAVEERARKWIEEHEKDFPGDRETGALGTSDEDRARFEDFANDAACPALDPATGRCDVYAWRPMTCRVFGPPVRAAGEDGTEGLGHCELCFIGATPQQVAACEMQVPHEMEAELVGEMGSNAETIVAFALLS